MSLRKQLTELEPGTITTIAGVGYRDGIPAREAPAGTPQGVVRIASGDLDAPMQYNEKRFFKMQYFGKLFFSGKCLYPGNNVDPPNQG